jgi:hypothetical protein
MDCRIGAVSTDARRSRRPRRLRAHEDAGRSCTRRQPRLALRRLRVTEARALWRGPPGRAENWRPPLRVLSRSALTTPRPTARKARRRAGRSFARPRVCGAPRDAARSYRRGSAATGGREAELTLRSVSVCGCDSAAVTQAAWVLGLLTALLTITRKSDYLRAVWDGDGL